MRTIGIAARVSKSLLYARTIKHIKHYRGYGIHSPFVYSLERNVFMKKAVVGSDKDVYDTLYPTYINKKRATQLQNLYSYSQYNGFAVDTFTPQSVGDNKLLFVSKSVDPKDIECLGEVIGSAKATVCVLAPKGSVKRFAACKKIVKAHDGLSVDNVGFLLIFFNDDRVKQHINI